jgi:hypothetical protein
MWEKVIEEFKQNDCFGSALPIACHRHPEDLHWIDSVERLRQVSPDGKSSLFPLHLPNRKTRRLLAPL